MVLDAQRPQLDVLVRQDRSIREQHAATLVPTDASTEQDPVPREPPTGRYVVLAAAAAATVAAVVTVAAESWRRLVDEPTSSLWDRVAKVAGACVGILLAALVWAAPGTLRCRAQVFARR